MYTLVGIITNSHGIKGAVKVYPYTFDVKRFEEYDKVFIGEEKELVKISKVSYYKNFVILTFSEYDDINNVLKFKGSEIYIKTSDRAILEDGNYYISDILECQVCDEYGKKIGNITEVIQGASNDIYVVEGEKLKGQIPAVKEFVKSVNLKRKVIVISPIEGMLNEV